MRNFFFLNLGISRVILIRYSRKSSYKYVSMVNFVEYPEFQHKNQEFWVFYSDLEEKIEI